MSFILFGSGPSGRLSSHTLHCNCAPLLLIKHHANFYYFKVPLGSQFCDNRAVTSELLSSVPQQCTSSQVDNWLGSLEHGWLVFQLHVMHLLWNAPCLALFLPYSACFFSIYNSVQLTKEVWSLPIFQALCKVLQIPRWVRQSFYPQGS